MQLLRRLSFTMLMMSLMTLVGCGGGDGGDLTGGGGGTDPEPDAIVITLSKSDGDLSGTNDVTITATVTEGNSAVANKLVTFTLSDDSLASFTPESGTAVTNASGVATIVVKATSVTGGVSVTATVDDVDPVSIGLTSLGGGEGPNELAVSLTISNPEVSAANPSVLTFSIRLNDVPVPDQLITFTIDNTELASFIPSAGTATTNAQGIATISVAAASKAGAGLVTASIDGNALATTTFTSLGDGNDGGSPEVASIILFASSQRLASSGGEVTLTAIAKDANNNLLAGVPVTFAADSNASIGPAPGDDEESTNLTDIGGRIDKLLTTVGVPVNRIVNVTATSGAVSDSLEVEVVGTTVTLAGSSSLALNDDNTFTIKVLNSEGTAIGTTPVSLSLTNEPVNPGEGVATITLPDSVITEPNGQVTISVVGSSGGSNTIVASALGASTTHDVSVQADSFLFTEFGDGSNTVNPAGGVIPDVLLSKTATITLTWLRSGEPVPDGTEVSFTTTRGNLTLNNGVTDGGKVTATLTSINAGKTIVSFAGTDTVNGKVIELNNQLEFEFVADIADRITAQAFPTSIGPNEQTSTISVIVRDPSGNLVKNKTVDFSLIDDITRGEIFPPAVVTDSDGRASTVYTSKNTSSLNGVTVEAKVREMPTVFDRVSLTVADREVFISLGTGNTIEVGEDETTYIKKYSVFVTDIDSQPQKDVTLSVSAVPEQYIKGKWVEVLKDGEFDHYATAISAICDNEDKNRNGELDAGEDDDPVNGNNDGRLTPANLVAVLGADGTSEIKTNAEGRAVINVIYPESFGAWATVDLIASTKVNGTESFARALFLLDVAAEDITTEGVPPGSNIPFVSDFGQASVCTNKN